MIFLLQPKELTLLQFLLKVFCNRYKYVFKLSANSNIDLLDRYM